MLIVAKRPQPESVTKALASAIRACYSGLLTQEQLEERIGSPQQTISKWARGASAPNVLQTAAIEAACDAEAERLGDDARRRPPGWISIRAGLVANVTTVPEAIAVDPRLPDDHAKASVLAAYVGVIEEYVPITGEDLRKRRTVRTTSINPLSK